jgi:hypothetical protein
MKIFGWIAGFAFLVSVSSVFADDVDFARTNVVLQALNDAAIAGDDLVDFAQPKFDEAYSSFKDEKLKYDMIGAMKSPPWLDGGRADVQLSSTYAADRNPTHTGIAVGMETTMKTDVMSLIRYSGMVALAKRSGDDPVFADRIIAHLTRLSLAHSLDDVYALLISGQTLAEEMIQAKIDRLTQLAANPTTPPYEVVDLQKDIAQWKVVLKGYKSVQITTEKSTAGNITKFTVVCEDGSPFVARGHFDVKPGRAALIVTADHFSASAEVFISRTADKLDQMKSQLQSRLIGLQNGNDDDKASVQETFRQGLIAFKDVVRAQNHY